MGRKPTSSDDPSMTFEVIKELIHYFLHDILRLFFGHTGRILIMLVTARWVDLDLDRGFDCFLAVTVGAMAWTLVGITLFIAFGPSLLTA